MTSLSVVGAVIVSDERILVCRRSPDRSAGGSWEFPGGKVEPGESPETALEREIREELGVAIVVGALVDRSSTEVAGREIDLSCYFATLVGEHPTASTDHSEFRWLRPTELPELDWSVADLPAVAALQPKRA